MAGFIEDDSQSDSDGGRARASEDDDERRARRRREKKERRKGKGARRAGFGSSMVEGIGQEAWQEVTDVFGNGQDYAYALEEDEVVEDEKELKDVSDSPAVGFNLARIVLTLTDCIRRSLSLPRLRRGC